ncbi:hyaluronan synthase [Streptomyces zhaozhouensis]|uniref:Hyaluronan synthase n=1 Tax=Streptomyces zhaozhouensis TaxID=1300267 RepID=A0A286DJ58_9ACTN|nr:glycosyltransferase family 2 protein [Streptomyces zhaozhouensis]SOD58623.1 hyaluronan synthase [Streptomyces zhaozhouensis]
MTPRPAGEVAGRWPGVPPPPTARAVSARWLVPLAVLPLTGFLAWVLAHGYALLRSLGPDGAGGPLALPWLVSFLLLWWVPLAWLERPRRAPADAGLDALTITVQVPVYNEDPDALRACLHSVLTQSRPVTRLRVVDDGSTRPDGSPETYPEVRAELLALAPAHGVEATWDRTANRGKRHAQMHVLATDDADVFVTVDSDSVLDRHAVAEGLKPFADPAVRSVAGQVVVLNHDANALTRLVCLLYLPFTRGLRSAQSVLRRVTINSGTLAFYRAEIVRDAAGVYENERFCGRPMQMNDDSMLTFYALLAGDTVHQPSALVFTLAPERWPHYLRQQLRWMRGTTVRHLWWLRYLPATGVVWWTTVGEYLHIALGLAIPAALMLHPEYREHLGTVLLLGVVVGVVMSYLMALRLFTVVRGDLRRRDLALLYAAAPLAAAWRVLVLRPLYLYAMLTCRRINQWGTRGTVEVQLSGR